MRSTKKKKRSIYFKAERKQYLVFETKINKYKQSNMGNKCKSLDFGCAFSSPLICANSNTPSTWHAQLK
jgi:hypothetical protein